MSCWLSRPPPRWTRGWSVQHISSSIPFPLHRAANASRMRPLFTKRKRSPPTRLALHYPSDQAAEPSPSAPAHPAQNPALFWSPMPRSGQNLREAGAPSRNAAASTEQHHRRAGAVACAAAPQSSSWHQQSCASPVHYAALRAFPPLTSTSDIRVHDGRRLVGVSHKRRGKCPSPSVA